MLVQKCLTLFTVHVFDSSSKSSLLSRQKQFENPLSSLFMLVMPGHQHVSLQTCWAFSELNEAHLLRLSCTTEPTLQALSLCLFLSNSHSLFTFAFLHCDSRQNNITRDPSGGSLSGLFIQRKLKQLCT